METIVTDQELALIKVIKKYFPNARQISCLFHYIQDILRNLRVYGLIKKNKKEESLNLLKKLGNISFLYKGKVENVDIECKNIANHFPNHKNFLSR